MVETQSNRDQERGMRATKANKTTQHGQAMTRLAKRAVLLGLLVASGSTAQAQQSSGIQINPRFYDNTAPQVVPQSTPSLNRPLVKPGTVKQNPFVQNSGSVATNARAAANQHDRPAASSYVPQVRRRPVANPSAPVPLAYTPGAAVPIQTSLQNRVPAAVSQISVSAADASQVIPVADAQNSAEKLEKQPVVFALSDDTFDAPDPKPDPRPTQANESAPAKETAPAQHSAPAIDSTPAQPPVSPSAQKSEFGAVAAQATKPATIDTAETAVKLAPVVEFAFPETPETTTESETATPASVQPVPEQTSETETESGEVELIVRPQQRLVEKKTPEITTLSDQEPSEPRLQSWDSSQGTVVAAPAPVFNQLPSQDDGGEVYRFADSTEEVVSENTSEDAESAEPLIAIEPWRGDDEVVEADTISVEINSTPLQPMDLGEGGIAVSLPPIPIERSGEVSEAVSVPFGVAAHDPTESSWNESTSQDAAIVVDQTVDSHEQVSPSFDELDPADSVTDVAMPQLEQNQIPNDRGTIHIAKALPVPMVPIESDQPVVSQIALDPTSVSELPSPPPASMVGVPVAVERVEVDITTEDQGSYTPPARLAFDEGTEFAGSSATTEEPADKSSNNVLLEVSKAQVRSMTIGGKLRRISVGDTQVCQAFASSENQLKLIGTGIGRTQLTVWADVVSGEPTRKQTFDIEVLGSVDARGAKIASRTKLLNESIDNAFPRASVVVALRNGELVVTGRCDDENTAKQIIRMVRKSCLVPVQDNLQVR